MNGDRLRYFAYGSNMMLDVFDGGAEHGRFLGPARLPDYRLAFTRDSQTWRAGAADVLPAPGMCVWGALYELSREYLETRLDPKEGAGFAYERVELEVVHEGDSVPAVTYAVIDKNLPELLPSPDYLQRMIEPAAACHLPESYRRFLESIRDEPSEAFREGYFALTTTSRRDAEGMGLLRVAPEVADKLKLKRLAAVRRKDRVCIAKVSRVAGLASDGCEVDQNIRQALGILGYESYGSTVTLHPVRTARFRLVRPLIQPRMLYLRLQRPRWMDSEKSICVLHKNNIRLLGLTEGDYVDVLFAVPIDPQARVGPAEVGAGTPATYEIRSASFRVFSGSAEKQPRGDEWISYPQIDELYLDADGRALIGVSAGAIDVPVTVGPDLGRLFSGRLLFYGATVFLAGAALWPLVDEATRLVGGGRPLALGLTVILSFTLTAVFALFDIRGRVRY